MTVLACKNSFMTAPPTQMQVFVKQDVYPWNTTNFKRNLILLTRPLCTSTFKDGLNTHLQDAVKSSFLGPKRNGLLLPPWATRVFCKHCKKEPTSVCSDGLYFWCPLQIQDLVISVCIYLSLPVVLDWGWCDPARGHLATSGDIFGCYNCWGWGWVTGIWGWRPQRLLDTPQYRGQPHHQGFPAPVSVCSGSETHPLTYVNVHPVASFHVLYKFHLF